MTILKEKQKRSTFLLEIGCEELPPSYAKSAILQLERIAHKVITEARLEAKKISSFGTYRRIGILVEGLITKQIPEKEEIIGPPKFKAFDEKGKPTATFFGFLKSHKVTKKNLHIKKIDKGEYLCIIKEKPTLDTFVILPALCKDIINSIQFPKTMRWANSFSFARPIRWIIALFDRRVIKIKVADVASGNFTFGHRLLLNKKIKISEPTTYFKLLKKHKVLVNPGERKEIIIGQLKEAIKKIGAEPNFEPNLLEEIVYLTEWPCVFIGNFKRKYLSLPPEVLLASMSKNQKTFALFKKNGKPLAFFAAVLDNCPLNIEEIKKNYENILEAKLKDAEFFYCSDVKTKLEDRNKNLEKLIFHKDLGSMLEKVKRLNKLARFIAEELNLNEKDKNLLERCAWLSKADLTTEMVKEFPSLQGVMGFYYAKKSGESNQVASAIKEHYLPRFSFDALPRTKYGSLISFIDKLDTITSCFAIDLIPTGSYDPYALRRQGQGLVRIALASKINISISNLLALDITLIEKRLKKEPAILKKEVLSFLKERVKPFLVEQAKRGDIVDAVLSATFDNFVKTSEKVKQLSSILNSKDFFKAFKVVERTAHILKLTKQDLPRPNPSFFREKLERDLFDIYQDKKEEILNLISKSKYALATKIYGIAFFDILHIFFDKVLINVENKKIKENRLALMRAINKLYTEEIADISQMKI
jgi:glycyl-tRNA synthetase beta chain